MDSALKRVAQDDEDGELALLSLPQISHDELTITPANENGGTRPDCLEFWESDRTRPAHTLSSGGKPQPFPESSKAYLQRCMEHPYLPQAEIKEQQLARMQQLVELAYDEIPVYRDKYQAAGFSPSDLKTYDDIQKIPVITKPELIAAFPDRCVNQRYRSEDLFPTRSSGSSGQTLLIRVDYDAILTDTIQGIRQFALQSGRKYSADDLLAHVYTVPWWFSSVDGDYQTAFISNVIPPSRVAQHLQQLAPKVLSLYPSNLEALMPYADEFKSSMYLAVTHSEYSSRAARQAWSQQLGFPVLDEYSSEEATRIALELPCGHYHVCEDTVHLDVLDPETMRPQTVGQSGLAVITNLLNEAMPFIRYVQGDYLTQPADPEPCDVQWSQIASIDGRMNDAFINKFGRKVPAGSMLDVTYRWMFDSDLHLAQFELVQKTPELIETTFVLGNGVSEARLQKVVPHLEDLLSLCMEHPVRVLAKVVDTFPPKTGKRRPIRRDFTA
ncbi:phenylacetate-CoA ligase [Rhizobiales bacterium GAS191]|nr:phenylacetate-CoA ligase [Rhizobiales bacterium GAS191]